MPRNLLHIPFLHRDHFAVVFHIEVTYRPSNRLTSRDKASIYTVKDGKIAQTGFFYCPNR